MKVAGASTASVPVPSFSIFPKKPPMLEIDTHSLVLIRQSIISRNPWVHAFSICTLSTVCICMYVRMCVCMDGVMYVMYCMYTCEYVYVSMFQRSSGVNSIRFISCLFNNKNPISQPWAVQHPPVFGRPNNNNAMEPKSRQLCADQKLFIWMNKTTTLFA